MSQNEEDMVELIDEEDRELDNELLSSRQQSKGGAQDRKVILRKSPIQKASKY